MEDLYRAIGKSRQDYAQIIKRRKGTQVKEEDVLRELRKWRIEHPKMGSRSCYYSMKEAGINLPMGINRFENLLSRHSLTVGSARRSGPHTSDGKGKRNYPNLTNGLVLRDINQLLVADITYFWIIDRWYYIFTLKDVYSQSVISLVPSENMKANHAVRTINDLVDLRGESALEKCIHHSDNGSQYEASIFTSKLTSLNIRISRAENCKQNGSAEQLNHILKNMYLKHYGIYTFNDLRNACKKIKYLMNEKRCIKQLGNITPAAFEQNLKSTPLQKRLKVQLHNFENTS